MMHKYPTSFQATDIVVWDDATKRFLLGKKPSQSFFRFVGGFVDPEDTSLEAAAIRELTEEAGKFEGFSPVYLFSFRVNDPRYKESQDKIMSAVFNVGYLSGEPKAGDDIGEVKWFDRDDLFKNYNKLVMPEHHIIVQYLASRNCYQ